MAADCRVTCTDWSLSHGNCIMDSIITKRISSNDTHLPSVLDDIVDENRAILLETTNLEACNVHFELPPTSFIDTVTVITDCEKLETFLGKSEEYHKTFYGELVDEVEGSRVYRYDIELRGESPVSMIITKFIPKEPSLWIYGIEIAIKPNLKALSAHMFGTPSIDFANVQNMLACSKSSLTPGAEKCKDFLQSYMNSKSSSRPSPTIETIMSMMNGNLLGSVSNGNNTQSCVQSEEQQTEKVPNSSVSSKTVKNENSLKSGFDMFTTIQHLVDSKIEQMETRIQIRLDELERRQNEKLDKIIELLSKPSL